MRLVVTSDSHRNSRDFFRIIERHMNNQNVMFINLGDSEGEVEELKMLYPRLRLENVAGNCDWSSTYPTDKMLRCDGKKVFITHGHQYYVKHGYQRLQEVARREEADIVLFGHTHIPYTEVVDGIQYMNPGAVCNSSYGIVDIEKSGIMAYTLKIER